MHLNQQVSLCRKWDNTVNSSLISAVHRASPEGRKVWIDLDNSPHVPFFMPIIEELEKLGYEVIVSSIMSDVRWWAGIMARTEY
jgi:hypothetical protein